MEKEKKNKVICFMGQHGCGKSSLINLLKKRFGYNAIKSYTTRSIREKDPSDKDTHLFVDINQFIKDKTQNKIMAEYHNKKENYFSWTTMDLFSDNVNLYAIDPEAFVSFKEKYSDVFDIFGVYIIIDEELRKKRTKKRGDLKEASDKLTPNILVEKLKLNKDYVFLNNNSDLNSLMEEVIKII